MDGQAARDRPKRKRRNAAARDRVAEALRPHASLSRPSTLVEEIYDALGHALRDGSLLPGQPISVRDLAATFDISPTPVREAIRRLEAQGVVETTPGRAVCVPGMRTEDVEETYTIRIALEGLAAEKAASRWTRSDLDIIQTAYEAMDSAVTGRNVAEFMEWNYRFHMAIYAAARMDRLMDLIEPQWLRISPFLWSLVEDRHLEFSMAQHAAARDALIARDAFGLRRAIENDISEAQRRLEAQLTDRSK